MNTYRVQLARGRQWLTPGRLCPDLGFAVAAMDQNVVARVVRVDGIVVAARNRSSRWVLVNYDGRPA